jgi:hypothetical protein
MPGDQLPQRAGDVSEGEIGGDAERNHLVLKDKSQTMPFRFAGSGEPHGNCSVEAGAGIGKAGDDCLNAFHRVVVQDGAAAGIRRFHRAPSLRRADGLAQSTLRIRLGKHPQAKGAFRSGIRAERRDFD